MQFKFKGYIGKSAYFPLPPLLLQLFVYVDCLKIMSINSINCSITCPWTGIAESFTFWTDVAT